MSRTALQRNRRPAARPARNGHRHAGHRASVFANDYPEPTPEAPPMRTQGEESLSTERVTMSVRMRFNPLRGLDPERLVNYLDQFDLGFFRLAAMTWDKIEKRNATLKCVVPKRKKAVARHGWEILIVNNLKDDQEQLAQQQKDALDHFFNNLTATDAIKPDEQGGLALLARQMMDAQAKYYAVHEIVWQPKPEGLTAQFVFCPLWWFEGITGKLRYLDSEFQIYGRDMSPSEWLVTCGEGLMEASSVCFIYLNLTLHDWLNYCERYGQPFIDAATSASPGSDEWEALKQYVRDMAADGGGVRSQSAQVNLIEAKQTAADTFQKMVENMTRWLTILWRGGDLGTTASKDATGATLQENESEILESDDCTLIEETLATKVSRFVIGWTFGPGTPVLAYLKFRRADKDTSDRDLKIDEFLLGAGAPLGVREALERYGRPCPESVGEDDVLTPPVVSPPSPSGRGRGEGENADLANAADPAALAEALHETILPLLKRLQAIAKIEDPGIQQHLLEKLLKDFPAIAEAIRHDNTLTKKLAPTLEAAFHGAMKKEAVA